MTNTDTASEITITEHEAGSVNATIPDGTGGTQDVTVSASSRPTLNIRSGVDFEQLPSNLVSNVSLAGITVEDNVRGTSIQLENLNTLNNLGGDIVFETAQVLGSNVVVNGGFIAASNLTNTNINGGDIYITTSNLSLLNNAAIFSVTFGEGDSGSVRIEASGDILMRGSESAIASEVSSDAVGNSGEVDISTTNLSVLDGAAVSTATFGEGDSGLVRIEASGDILMHGFGSRIASVVISDAVGNSGGIDISTTNLSVLDGALVSSSTLGEGDSGLLQIKTSDDIRVRGSRSSIGSAVISDAVGNSGGVDISTTNLSVLNGAAVSAATFGEGDSGPVRIEASGDIHVRGSDSSIDSAVDFDAVGDSGGVDISTTNLSVLNGAAVSALTLRQRGTAGDVLINVGKDDNPVNSILVNGEESRITAEATENGGNAGRVQLNVRELTVENGGEITTANLSGRSRGITLTNLETLDILTGGRIVASTRIGEAGDVEVNARGGSIRLSGVGTQLTAEATGSGGRAGDIDVRANQLSIRNGAQINISTIDGKGGAIRLTVSNLSILNGLILAETENGVAGQLTLNRRDNRADRVLLSGVLEDDTPAGLSVEASGVEGEAGILRLFTRDLIVRDGADLSAETVRGNVNNEGDSIRITRLENLVLDNARISASTQRSGFAGGVTIKASESVRFQGFWVDQDGEAVIDPNINPDGTVLPAGVFVEGRDRGIARPLEIVTGQLILENGAQASVSTENGRGGDLNIRANDSVRISDGAGLFARATGVGEAGSINIETPDLLLLDGAMMSATNISSSSDGVFLNRLERLRVLDSEISTSTRRGIAGDVLINREEDNHPVNTVLVSGDNARIAAETTGNGGEAGSVQLNANDLIIENGGIVTVSSNAGQSGTLTVRSPMIRLNNGQLTAATAFTSPNQEGGDVSLDGLNLLLLENGSLISAEASEDADGGNIIINADDGFVVATPLNSNSDIIATAERGTGGNINIFATQIFGLSESNETLNQVRRNITNGISASSEFGADGLVSIEDVGVDPLQGVDELPSALVDASSLVAPTCEARPQTESDFAVTGCGGIAPTPETPLTSDSSLDDLGPSEHLSSYSSSYVALDDSNPTPIIEAHGWQTNADGQVTLVAHTSNQSEYSYQTSPHDCRTLSSNPP